MEEANADKDNEVALRKKAEEDYLEMKDKVTLYTTNAKYSHFMYVRTYLYIYIYINCINLQEAKELRTFLTCIQMYLCSCEDDCISLLHMHLNWRKAELAMM